MKYVEKVVQKWSIFVIFSQNGQNGKKKEFPHSQPVKVRKSVSFDSFILGPEKCRKVCFHCFPGFHCFGQND